MNYLAHSLLSFSEEPILFGQFIADDIKGSQWKEYSKEIQVGILLHRFIDDFTDRHALLIDLRKHMHPVLGKFSGVALDVIFDHVLSLRWEEYSTQNRTLWIQETYRQLSRRAATMSDKRKYILSKMIEHDWMHMYQSKEGTSSIMEQMSRRIAIENPLSQAIRVFEAHQNIIISAFDQFFPQLLSATQSKLNTFANTVEFGA